MCHSSPASLLVWAVLMSLLGGFLLFHLWSFDRFQCLKWSSGPYSGAFKRLMTYSYLLSIPLIVIYSVGLATVKYSEGYMQISGMGIVPTPYQSWQVQHQRLLFPLYLLFSIAWSLEMVTHLEELCFWLFLINAGSARQDWFRSAYFKTWAIGSICAIIYMPLIPILSRGDALRSEAFTFLGGSLGSLSLTIWFIPILWTFPTFLENLRKEGVELTTIVRLTKFHELNILRIIFRFTFVIPFLILGIDGVRLRPLINHNMLWTDLLAMLGAIGCVVSSAITLVIFFPRSIEGEIAARDAAREKRMSRKRVGSNATQMSADLLHSSTSHGEHLPPPPSKVVWKRQQQQSLPPLRPNRRREIENGPTSDEIDTARLTSRYNPLVHNFTSPIDIAYVSSSPKEPKFTFTRNMA